MLELISDNGRIQWMKETPKAEPGWINHIICEGARWHVLTYSADGMKCSEPRCIINKRIVNDRS